VEVGRHWYRVVAGVAAVVVSAVEASLGIWLQESYVAAAAAVAAAVVAETCADNVVFVGLEHS
jgi:hypothetical protein